MQRQEASVRAGIPLTLACGSYDINQGLIDGTTNPDGIDLTVLAYPSPERHWRMLRHEEFDACELSMASFLMLRDRGRGLTAIPAFPHRRFRHGYIYVNAAAGIDQPADLEGRRVGLRTWQTTAGLWARGILQDGHGIDLKTIEWVCQDEEDIPFDPPTGYRLGRVAEGDSVTAMLERGDLDALIYPEVPAAFQRGDPRVRTLFADPKAAEIAWFGTTGFFPIMHTVVIKDSIAAAHPWMPRNLLLAFRASKDLAFQRAIDPRRISLAWVAQLIDEQRRILGDDPWSYAFEPNRRLLAQMIRWSHQQGMISREFDPEDLFFPATRDELPTYV
jgi:4,5-dihydroxyphthalate decarboxylase